MPRPDRLHLAKERLSTLGTAEARDLLDEIESLDSKAVELLRRMWKLIARIKSKRSLPYEKWQMREEVKKIRLQKRAVNTERDSKASQALLYVLDCAPPTVFVDVREEDPLAEPHQGITEQTMAEAPPTLPVIELEDEAFAFFFRPQ